MIQHLRRSEGPTRGASGPFGRQLSTRLTLAALLVSACMGEVSDGAPPLVPFPPSPDAEAQPSGSAPDGGAPWNGNGDGDDVSPGDGGPVQGEEPSPPLTDGGATPADGDEAPPPDSGTPPPPPPALDCSKAEPPRQGLRLWLKAGEGLTLNGDRVVSWADQAGGAPARQDDGQRRPRLMSGGLNGRPVLNFENGQQFLHRDVPINGLPELTIVFVNATPTLEKARPEWCQHQDCDPNKPHGPRQTTETGCSGTYQKVLWWLGARSWGGVYLSPKQEEVAFRFGNGHSTYSPNTCNISHDPWVSWKRPQSIGPAFSSTVAVHTREANLLYVDGSMVSRTPIPGGVAEVDAVDRLEIGNGFGQSDDRNRGGLVAEVLVYGRALPEPDRDTLETYLACHLFPGRLPSKP